MTGAFVFEPDNVNDISIYIKVKKDNNIITMVWKYK